MHNRGERNKDQSVTTLPVQRAPCTFLTRWNLSQSLSGSCPQSSWAPFALGMTVAKGTGAFRKSNKARIAKGQKVRFFFYLNCFTNIKLTLLGAGGMTTRSIVYINVSLPRHFGAIIIWRGDGPGTPGCLTASPASTHEMPVAPSQVVTILNASRCCHRPPGRQKSPWVDNHLFILEITYLSFLVTIF